MEAFIYIQDRRYVQMSLLMYAMDATLSYDATIMSRFQTLDHIRFLSVRKTSKTNE